MSFLQEVLEYNTELRREGFTVVVGVKHGVGDHLHFHYTSFNGDQRELHISYTPEDYTEWNNLKEWAKT